MRVVMSVANNPGTETLYWQIPKTDLRIRTGLTPYGMGVFACHPIPKGTELGEVRGKIIEDEDYE
mgnify:FL=1